MIVITARKNFIVFSRVCDFFFFFFTITLERLNLSKPNFHARILAEIARPCAKMGITGHMWPPLIGGFCPHPHPPWNFTYLQFQPIQTNFHTTFDWNSSTKFENGHQRSNVTPPKRGFLPSENSIFFFFFFFVCYHDNSWKARPVRTKFSNKTFNWISSDRFENGHRRSHVPPPP